MLKIEQPWGDHRLKMNGVYIGCVTKENADVIMRLQRLAVVIESDKTQPVFRRDEARELVTPNAIGEGPGAASCARSLSTDGLCSTDKQETVMERPKVTPEMIAQAAQSLAAENGWDADQVADVVKCYRNHIDGYELAKELESRCYWSISVMDVDALDCMDSEVREIHRAACLAWAKEHDVQPPLPIGTMTTRGEITGISTYDAAAYLIRENGETNESRRLIVRFEDARAA